MLEIKLENHKKEIDVQIEPYGSGRAIVTSVNGKTGKVVITAEDLGTYSKEEIDKLIASFNERFFLFYPTENFTEEVIKLYNLETLKKIFEKENNVFDIFLSTKSGNVLYSKINKTDKELSIEFLVDEDSLVKKGITFSLLDENIIYTTENITSETVPEIYIGSGDMPEGYVLQIDPEGEADLPSEGGITLANKAEVGQIIKVAEVNENGAPTEWEAVDFPKSNIQRVQMTALDSVITLEPNKFYVFPQMSGLVINLGGEVDASIVQEYKFRFTSSSPATTLYFPSNVIGTPEIPENSVVEISIIDGYLVSQSWAVSE